MEIDKFEQSKIEEAEMAEVGEHWERCYSCGCKFRAKNWHTPPDCPHCGWSRVE